MPINLQEIIDNLNTPAVKTAEVTTPATAEVATVPATTTPATTTQDADLTKVAEEMDEAGRVMARAFYDELTKIAVGATGYQETAAEINENPAVQTSIGPEGLPDAMKVVGILGSLTAGERLHGSEGYIQVNGQPVAPTQTSIAEITQPTAYDAAKAGETRATAGVDAKVASARVVTTLYDKYFGGK